MLYEWAYSADAWEENLLHVKTTLLPALALSQEILNEQEETLDQIMVDYGHVERNVETNGQVTLILSKEMWWD
jgi:hypothetical protein